MGFIDDILLEFGGDLSYEDILHMSHKEIGYLRKHRRARKEKGALTPKEVGKSMTM